MKLKNIKLSRQTQKTTCYMIPFVSDVNKRQIYKDRELIIICLGQKVVTGND